VPPPVAPQAQDAPEMLVDLADIDLSTDDEALLDLDTGSLSAANQQFSSGLSALKASMTNAATVWNGQMSELLNLPLSPTIVEALTVEQIEGWGAKGNVRMLLGVLNTPVPASVSDEAAFSLQGHRETALRVILGRGAKSLDALVLSLTVTQSERIVRELDGLVQAIGDVTARGGALAALQMIADAGGPFGRTIAALISDARLAGVPNVTALRAAAKEKAAASAVIRVEAVLATHEKGLAEYQAHCKRLQDLADTVINGPDGPVVRVRHIPTVAAGFEDLRVSFGQPASQSADSGDLTEDLLRLRRVTAALESPELDAVMGRLEDLWLTVLQERCAFAATEAAVAIAFADRANFKGLPVIVASKERLAMLAQAGAELAGMSENLRRELDDIDRQVAGLPGDSPVRARLVISRKAIAACDSDLQQSAEAVLQAIGAHESAIRTDEAMFRKRVIEIETLAQSVPGLATTGRTEAASAIRDFAVLGGAYSRMGGLRMLANVLEGIAALVDKQEGADRSAVVASLLRIENAGLVRQPEIDAVKNLLATVDWLG
jgi:hypothetical protein